jgi:hypothetical protein
MFWVPVEEYDWLTDCTTYLDQRTVLEVFYWPPLRVRDSDTDEDDDPEMRAWAQMAREASTKWAKENPY